MEATVSEIHAYPLRPAGYAEPLFHDQRSKKEILEHLAQSEWLFKASQAPAPTARDAARLTEASTEEVTMLASWREVDRWWEEGGGVDRLCYLVSTTSGGEETRSRPPHRA